MLRASILHQSSTVTVRDVTCSGEFGCGRCEESQSASSIAFLRRGAFLRRDTYGRHNADATRVLFFNSGMSYRVDHPDPHGDRCTVLTFADAELRDACLPGARGKADAAFDRGSVPSTPGIMLDHYRLVRAAETGDAFQVRELALGLLAQVSAADRGRQRTSTESRNAAAQLARKAQSLLGARFREPWTVELIASELNVSAFHLCRKFREQTGRSLHAYLTDLRLNEALELLPRYTQRLSQLALDLGFAHHSHFTQVFRDHFGQTPLAFSKS